MISDRSSVTILITSSDYAFTTFRLKTLRTDKNVLARSRPVLNRMKYFFQQMQWLEKIQAVAKGLRKRHDLTRGGGETLVDLGADKPVDKSIKLAIGFATTVLYMGKLNSHTTLMPFNQI